MAFRSVRNRGVVLALAQGVGFPITSRSAVSSNIFKNLGYWHLLPAVFSALQPCSHADSCNVKFRFYSIFVCNDLVFLVQAGEVEMGDGRFSGFGREFLVGLYKK